MKKININEVISGDGNLISIHNDQPKYSPEKANMSTKPTDYNVGMGRQAADDDEYMGLLGFTFRESEENKTQNIIDIVAEYEFEQYKKHIKYFLGNLSKEKIKEYKILLKKKFSDLKDEEKKSDYKYAKGVLSLIKKNLKKENTIEENDIIRPTVDPYISDSKSTIKVNKISELIKDKILTEKELSLLVINILGFNKDLNIDNVINSIKQYKKYIIEN